MLESNPESLVMLLGMLEAGFLLLDGPFPYAMLLVGGPMTGKTTAAYYLAKRPLIGYLKNSIPRYKAVPIGNGLPFAEIGQENEPKTIIPNIFPTFGLSKDQTILFDCPPSSMNTLDSNRVLAKSFFEYQLFTQVCNLKFIFTFCFSDMEGPATPLYDSFQEFISGFTDFDKIGGDIMAATCFLVTKVPKSFTR